MKQEYYLLFPLLQVGEQQSENEHLKSDLGEARQQYKEAAQEVSVWKKWNALTFM